MNNSIQLVEQFLPPAFGTPSLTFNENQNLLTTAGYVSLAGNTYFKGVRISDRIFLVLDIGIGYAHTFLNGLKIFSNQGAEKKLIAEKSYHSLIFNEAKVKVDAKVLVTDALRTEISKGGVAVDETWLTDFVNTVVEDTYKNQIETLKTLQVNKLLEK